MRIIVGVTGSIAAFKSATLVRLLIKSGHQVKVVMTQDAAHFIAPLTLSTLSKNPIQLSIADEDGWNNHVEMGLWADLMIIAPGTANTLAKMAHGICDNLLLAVYLSAKCPIWFAPAMDLDMWTHPSTQENVKKLQSYKDHTLIQVDTGELASGLIGPGRMAEPESILKLVDSFETKSQNLSGLKVLITAGPTREYIDPVRFISNPSSGKMGLAIAEEFNGRGAEVTLVLGPVANLPGNLKFGIVHVTTAQEMYEATLKHYKESSVVVFTAAVADFTPQEVSDTKIKKGDSDWNVSLQRTKDIAATLGKFKKDQVHIGFALESSQGDDEAQQKLAKKNFDFIVLNSLQNKGAGFGYDTNQVTIYDNKGSSVKFDLKSKTEVAEDIVEYYEKHYKK